MAQMTKFSKKSGRQFMPGIVMLNEEFRRNISHIVATTGHICATLKNIEPQCIPHASNETDPPSASTFMHNLQPFQVVFLAIGSPLTLAVFGLAFLQFYYVWMLISSEERRNNLYFLISLLPVSTACCLIGMFCPGLQCFYLHLAFCRQALSQLLTEKRQMISFQSPPFCCCLFCLPKAHPSEANLMKLEWIVLQAPIVRLVIVFGQVIAVAEQRENALKWLHLFDLASSASLLLAIFGIHTLARVTSQQLSQYGFSGIFRIVDVALLFYSAQQPILFQNILLRFGVIHCGPLLSPQDNARFICNFVIIVQFFLLSLFSTFLVSPRRNNLFDLYRDKQHGSTPTMISSCPTENGLEDGCPALPSDMTPMTTLLNDSNGRLN
uniref:Organic solute transporter alpha-like protein n=1 Tax=Ditylenchus dipsaci TaxID=166011 RepID=A0A915EBD0_9BILA